VIATVLAKLCVRLWSSGSITSGGSTKPLFSSATLLVPREIRSMYVSGSEPVPFASTYE
jgi:hypothetical protein